MKPTKPAAPGSVFSLSGVPPAGELIPLGLQHVVAAIVGIITPDRRASCRERVCLSV